MTEETRPENVSEARQEQVPEKPAGEMADAVARGARLLGLAALGAIVAVSEGSSRFFRALVEKGERAEPQARQRLESVSRKVGYAAGRIEKGARDLGDRARGFARRGEQFLDERVACALRRAGLPTREEIRELMARVDALGARLEALTQRLQPDSKSEA
ncbi:MAG: phasin family protein [Bryobacteraceae bacterium]